MKDKPTYPTATMFDERYNEQRGHHLLVTHARKRGDPLYYVRSSCGTTLDCGTSLPDARKVQAKEPGSKVYALKGTALTEVTV